jgi:hypothetical protein
MTLADLSPQQLRMLYGDNFIMNGGPAEQDGPMNDLSFPMPQDYGMENEARRLSNYPAPMTLADLTGQSDGFTPTASQMGAGGTSAPKQDISTMPIGRGMGAFQRSGGNLVNLKPEGWVDSVTNQVVGPNSGGGNPAQNLPLDYANPLDYQGTKGYRIKGDSSRALLSDGRMINLDPADAMSQRKAARDEEEFQLKRQKALAELDQTRAQTNKLNRPPTNNGMPEGFRLGPDQRYNPATGEAEAIPGSKLHLKQKDEFTKDLGYARSVADTTSATMNKIDTLLKDKDKFTSLFGGYNAQFGSQYLPSGRDANSILESIKADMAGLGLARMRVGGSIGQITEKEWKLLQDQLARVGPELSEEQAKSTLNDVRGLVSQINDRTQQQYSEQWGDSSFAKNLPSTSPPPAPRGSGAEQQAALMREAEAAIAKGAPRDAVMQRLQEKLKGR